MIPTILIDDLISEGHGSLAAGPFGSAVSAKFFADAGMPMIRGSNLSTNVGTPLVDDGYVFLPAEVTDKFPRSQARKGDLIFTCWGTIDQVGWIPNWAAYERYLVSNKQMRLRLDPKVCNSRYLYYFFSSELGQSEIRERRIGSSVPGFNLTGLRTIGVPLPSLSDQNAIVSILGALDDKIELNRRMSATLEEMARALYRSWFVDFDPVRARALGQSPAHMDPTTAALFPDSFSPDGLPNGWEMRPIGSLIEDTIGGDWGKEVADEKNDTPVSIIRGTDFPGLFEGGKAGVPSRYTTRKKADRRSLQPFDIVLEVSGGSPKQPTGRTLLITETELDRFTEVLVPASFCRRLRPCSAAHGLLVFLHVQQLYIDGGTWSYQNQSTGISNFQTPRFLADEKVVLPSHEVLAAFQALVEPLLVRARSNQNIALSTLRDTLLPRLMSGDLRIREAAQQVEGVV